MSEALIQDMIDAGCPAMLIAKVAAELGRLQGELASLDRRRAADRSRQQTKRENDRHDCHVTSRDNADVTDKPSLDKSPQTPKINPTPGEHTQDAPARKGRAFPCPDGVDPQHWSDFLANRQRKRLANTPTAYRGVLAKLSEVSDDEWPPGRVVQFAAERGWGGIFDPRGRDDGRPQNDYRNGQRASASGMGRTIDAAIDFVREAERGHAH